MRDDGRMRFIKAQERHVVSKESLKDMMGIGRGEKGADRAIGEADGAR